MTDNIQKAIDLYQAGKPNSAIDLLLVEAEANPTSNGINGYLASLLCNEERYVEAVKYINRCTSDTEAVLRCRALSLWGVWCETKDIDVLKDCAAASIVLAAKTGEKADQTQVAQIKRLLDEQKTFD